MRVAPKRLICRPNRPSTRNVDRSGNGREDVRKKNLIENRAPTHTSTAIPPKIKTKQAGGDKSKLRLQNKILIIQKATRILRQCELPSKQQKNRTNFDGESIKPLNVFHKGAAIYLIKIRINHPEMSPKNATHPASSPRI